MKRIASIQDFSCLGKCSQTVALPVLSAMGVECAALPTAFLSTHTAFEGFVSYDMTECLPCMIDHWQALGVQFDAIYTGYLASAAQISLVKDFFECFGTPQTLRFVDPVMADHGKLYAGFPEDFPDAMRRLCSRADVLTPNVTEACLLTGLPYRETHDETYTNALLTALLKLGCKTAVITGIRPDEAHMGVAALQADGTPLLHLTDYVPALFHGTGDLFAASCVGALLRGLSLRSAIALAADYVVKTIRVTLKNSEHAWYGVDFEATLPDLMAQLQAKGADTL